MGYWFYCSWHTILFCQNVYNLCQVVSGICFLHTLAASYISFVHTIGNLKAKHPQNCRMSSLGSHKAKRMKNAIISYILLLDTCSMCESGDTGVMFLKAHSTQPGVMYYGLPLLGLIFSYS